MAYLEPNENRQYPPPTSPWIMAMVWSDLLFMHWRVDAAALRPYLPPGLEIQEWDGSAWIGVVPFRMSGVRARLTPPLPRLSAFPELNVRTYVSAGGRPGVWFFSLDASRHAAVVAARRVYHLPYMDARMASARAGEWVAYRSHRSGPFNTLVHGPTLTTVAEFVGRYRPHGSTFRAKPGSLESFLTDRYCLYSWSGARLYRGEIHHEPWPLRAAAADIERNTMTGPLGITLGGEPLLHFAERLDVVGWWPVRA